MLTRPCQDWKHFQARLDSYFTLPMAARDRFIFRGQASSKWSLTTTLDRFCLDDGLMQRREDTEQALLSAFREGMRAIDSSVAELDSIEHVMTIARHAGLPSSIMDWTHSPYIAAYFAFAKTFPHNPHDTVSIWCVDCSKLDDNLVEAIQVIDASVTLSRNPRANAQQAVAVRVLDGSSPLEVLLPEDSLRRFDLPASEASVTLQRLEAMRIDAAELLGGVEGVVSHAAWRTTIRLAQGDSP